MNVINNQLAAEKLKKGFPVIFQTDTLPAIGCLPKFSEIIYEIKKRDNDKPLILMGSEKAQFTDYVHESAREDYENISSKYWPGALTIVVPIAKREISISTSNDLTLGLRIPNSIMAQKLIKETGPLLTSSANISGISGSMTPEGISLHLPTVDILGPVPWEICSGSASTIIAWVSCRTWRIIRQGQVLVNELN